MTGARMPLDQVQGRPRSSPEQAPQVRHDREANSRVPGERPRGHGRSNIVIPGLTRDPAYVSTFIARTGLHCRAAKRPGCRIESGMTFLEASGSGPGLAQYSIIPTFHCSIIPRMLASYSALLTARTYWRRPFSPPPWTRPSSNPTYHPKVG
jgi:hypothetical protein